MLRLYSIVNATPHSCGDLSNPIAVTAPANSGQISVQKLYLHNDDASRYYTGIALQVPANLLPNSISAKLLFQVAAPTVSQWSVVNSGNIISLPDIGSEDGADLRYQALWLRLEVSKDISIGTYVLPKIRLSAKEHSI